ncbi:fluoride efflux transporter FluC [Weissella tructae]|uniref:Fluoride-specific ion channel n=1 Tax=Weissella tructae TaxID=887702 RepID=A0ABM5QR37_9LACO|nr:MULTISPECIES: CrcB family protein [Weissella]AIG65214.1 Putative fluoride ion transporter CrcB [Weissella tructae]AIM63863.1 Putative fluoride ion transporter CrcB [Weissella ceti]ELA07614.1 CrcB protein [Weissella ceti NC36]QVV91595.1 CrcB family protein [Weissella tructae]
MKRQILVQILAVFVGGLIGGAVRETLMLTIKMGQFPLNTVVVNLTGVFLAVLVTTKLCQSWHKIAYVHEFLDVGILGAYTTYGTVILDLATKTSFVMGMIYLTTTIVGSVFMIYLARYVGRRWS